MAKAEVIRTFDVLIFLLLCVCLPVECYSMDIVWHPRRPVRCNLYSLKLRLARHAMPTWLPGCSSFTTPPASWCSSDNRVVCLSADVLTSLSVQLCVFIRPSALQTDSQGRMAGWDNDPFGLASCWNFSSAHLGLSVWDVVSLLALLALSSRRSMRPPWQDELKWVFWQG